MGNTIEQWRARVGTFVRVRSSIKEISFQQASYDNPKNNSIKNYVDMNSMPMIIYVLSLFVICMLLVMSGLETNPGPNNTNENAQISDALNDLEGLGDISPDTRVIITTLSQLFVNGKTETLNAVRELSEKFETEMATVNEEISELKKSNDELREKVDQLENANRKNNIVVFGLPEVVNNDPVNDITTLAQENLNVVINIEDIEQAYRIGTTPGRRPLLVSFSKYKSKLSIMENVYKLKGSLISINDDLTPKARAIKKRLVKCAREARDCGFNVKIRDNGLIINGNKISLDVVSKPNWLQTYIVTSKGQNLDSNEINRKRLRELSQNSDNDDDSSGTGNEMVPPPRRGGSSMRSRSDSLTKKSKAK